MVQDQCRQQGCIRWQIGVAAELIADAGYTPQITAAFADHQLASHALFHVLCHVTMNQVGAVVAGYDERACLAVPARRFYVEHSSGIQVLGQTVHHPLVTYFVLVYEGNFYPAAGWHANFVLAHAEDHAGHIFGVFPALREWSGRSHR